MSASDVIRAQLDDIIQEWTSAVCRDVPAAAHLPRPVLCDDIPDLLRGLADWLENGDGEATARGWEAAHRHATQRLAHDFDLAQVLHEYDLLRCAVLRRLLPPSGLQEVVRVNQAIDAAVTASARRFAAEHERMLRAEAERLHLALEAAALGTWEWRPQSDEHLWDPRTRALFGVPEGEPVDHERFGSRLHPDDRARYDAQVQPKVDSAAAGDDYQIEYRVRGIAGEAERWVAARGRVVERDAGGRAVRLVGVVADVTERKRSEHELAEREEFRERFVAIVSHDLRNPLNATQAAASLLLRLPPLPATVNRHARMILDNSQRMARMIGDLLDLTRSRLGGGIPVELRAADLHEIAPAVIHNLQLARPGRGIVCEEHGVLGGEWDPDRVAQAVGNLVANALDHGDPGAPVRVELWGDDRDRVSVTVHNEGTPIPPEQQPELFEPFHRGDGRREGLGLGLFIACQIARAHGGALSVRSTADEGTTFRLELPRHPRRAA